MRSDFHVHTCYSQDTLTPLEMLIEACRRRRLDKMAITDHNVIDGALALHELAPELIIVGEEIKTTNGELMAFFIEEWIPPYLSPEETIARIRAQGGLVGVSHPLDRFRSEAMGEEQLLRIIEQVDVLEVFNARTLLRADNRRAAALARAHGLPGTAGSDAHTAFEIGQAWVEMPPFDGRDDFLEALARGRVEGRLSSPLVHFSSTWARLRRRMSNRSK